MQCVLKLRNPPKVTKFSILGLRDPQIPTPRPRIYDFDPEAEKYRGPDAKVDSPAEKPDVRVPSTAAAVNLDRQQAHSIDLGHQR